MFLSDRAFQKTKPTTVFRCRMRRCRQSLSAVLTLLLIVLHVGVLGCARRQLQISSFPEGAAVSVDHQPVGYTPVAVPFQYNGTREILIEKDGYKSVRVKEPVHGPWYFYPPFSLFSENFAGREIQDKRRLEFALEPLDQVNDQRLIDRAENLRGQVLQGAITPSMQRQNYVWDRKE